MRAAITLMFDGEPPPSSSPDVRGPETKRRQARTSVTDQWLRNRPTLLSLCLRWTSGNASEAEDLLSDAYLRILESHGNAIIEVGNCVGFWATVINNLGRDRARRLRRWNFERAGCDVDALAALPARTISAERYVYSRECLSSMIARLDSLRENQRNAVLLRCSGLGYSGIGEMLGTTEANARKLVETARRALSPPSARKRSPRSPLPTRAKKCAHHTGP